MLKQSPKRFLGPLLLALLVQACAVLPPEIARPTPSELNERHAEFDGGRVRVRGLLIIEFENVGLYESLEAYYRYDDDFAADRKESWVGIMLPADILEQRMKYNRTFVEVTGTFDDACRNFAAKGKFLVCRGTPGEGTLVDVKVGKWLSPPWQRLGHGEMRAGLADYRIMDADWPDYDAVVSLSRDWLMAVLADDADAVLSLEKTPAAGGGSAKPLPTTSAYYDLLFGKGSRFQQLTPLNLRRPVAVLSDLWAEKAGRGPHAKVCFCNKEDCTGEWPLTRQDLYTDGPFPYVCTGFSKTGGAWRWDFR